MGFYTMADTVAGPSSLADLSTLISGIKEAVAWIFGLFSTVIDTIASNSLLLYPVLFALVMGGIALVVKIIRKFGLKSRRS